MKIEELEKLENEGVEDISSTERRKFIKLGFVISGAYLGGKILALTSAMDAFAFKKTAVPALGEFPYNPHYTMVLREHRCIDCEMCKDACVEQNHVPEYGYRTTILEMKLDQGPEFGSDTTFMPILCNHCNNPPCVRVCPTTATWKDEKTGIVRMNNQRCIGCKTCMTACPYNARYFSEEIRSVDKCDFCWESRLSKGIDTPACVEACPADVRVFGNLADPESRVFKLLHTPGKLVWVLRPETKALPNVFYINH
jgi:Fe-S-cluster-containing dehydrogenase component